MRQIEIGKMKTGKRNNICDVDGVMVGHYTVHSENHHTGITAILPHNGNMFKEKVVGASFVLNGFGKAIGLVQVNELGTIETPILLTNTLNAPLVANGLLSYMLKENDDIGLTTGTVNPLVLECNDSNVNNIRERILGEKEVFVAIKGAKDDFLQGAVGAGSGMTCLGYKGGIGSSSRCFNIDDKEYTIGVLVNSNFQGSHPESLVINGKISSLEKDNDSADQGSIIIVVATDLPCDNKVLRRISKRAALALSKTGSYCGNGSGDIVVSFTTQNKVMHYPKGKIRCVEVVEDSALDIVFKAVIESTEEAVINSLLNAETVKGYDGKIYYSYKEKNK